MRLLCYNAGNNSKKGAIIMRKRISARVICLLVAAVILVGALTVSAINGSPYENLKSAAINAMFHENFTVEGEYAIRINGQPYDSGWMKLYHGINSRLEITESGGAGDNALARHVNYTTPYFIVQPARLDDSTWYRISRQWTPPGQEATLSRSLGHSVFGQAGRDSNYLRLAEMAADFFVGDLKNNLTMSSSGGTRRISGAITESQLPETVRVLIDIALDEQLRWATTTRTREEYGHTLNIPIRSMSINRIQVNADIDAYGNLVYISALGAATIENIFNEILDVEIETSFRFTDIGTTVPPSPFEGIDEIIASAFGTSSSQNRFFTLDENGNIDINSVTDQWPSTSNTR